MNFEFEKITMPTTSGKNVLTIWKPFFISMLGLTAA